MLYLIILVILLLLFLLLLLYLLFNKKKDSFDELIGFKTYYINLERRTDKNEDMLKQISKSNLLKNTIQRFNAIDGNNIDLNQYIDNDLSLKTLKERKGWIGCALSHIELWKKCVKDNVPYLIFEDDIKIKNKFDYNISNIFNNLPSQFDIIYLITDDNNVKYELYNKFYMKIIDGNFLLASYIISPKGANLLLNKTTPYIPKYQIDGKIVGLTNRNILKCFIYKTNIVQTIQDFNKSDIQINHNFIKKFGKDYK